MSLVPVFFCPCRCGKQIDAQEYERLTGRTPERDGRRAMFFHEKTEGGCYCWMGPGECELHPDREES